MGVKNQKTVNTHHAQVDKKRQRRDSKKKERRIAFEINRAHIKVKVETERAYFFNCVLVFTAGLGLIIFALVYIVGVILYG